MLKGYMAGDVTAFGAINNLTHLLAHVLIMMTSR